jgi:hypothetical protein
MNGFKIPLDFSNGNIYKNNSYKKEDKVNEKQKLEKSIENFVKLLLYSPNGAFKPDYDFGFSLNNFKFENVGNAKGSGFTINNKKIKEYDNDLKQTIEKFETRLKDIRVTTELNSEKTKIEVTLNAKYLNNTDFNKTFTFYIWKKK